VNGILKNEFLPGVIYPSHEEARKSVSRNIEVYNQKWPHSSLDNLTPEQAHIKEGTIKKCWKRYKKIKPRVSDNVNVEE
jgi:putative transposase